MEDKEKIENKTNGLIEVFLVIAIFIIGYVTGCFAMKMDCQKEIERRENYDHSITEQRNNN